MTDHSYTPGTPLPWMAETVNEQPPHYGIVREGHYRPLAFVRDEQDARFISAACNLHGELVEALTGLCRAAEYWAGCDEDCSQDAASSEIMSSGGAWPAQAYDKACALLAKAKGGAS